MFNVDFDDICSEVWEREKTKYSDKRLMNVLKKRVKFLD